MACGRYPLTKTSAAIGAVRTCSLRPWPNGLQAIARGENVTLQPADHVGDQVLPSDGRLVDHCLQLPERRRLDLREFGSTRLQLLFDLRDPSDEALPRRLVTRAEHRVGAARPRVENR